MLPLIIVFQKKLGYSIKKRREKKREKKEREQISHSEIKRDLASPSFPQILQVF
jgi:hypothetical protein